MGPLHGYGIARASSRPAGAMALTRAPSILPCSAEQKRCIKSDWGTSETTGAPASTPHAPDDGSWRKKRRCGQDGLDGEPPAGGPVMTAIRICCRASRLLFSGAPRAPARGGDPHQSRPVTDQYVAAGMSTAEAQQAARRSFGGVVIRSRRYRDQRGLPSPMRSARTCASRCA